MNEPIGLILDSSAFVRGIGNIKRWLSETNVATFVPSYTLHELDYLKKGLLMLATNARESIRYMDRVISLEDVRMEIEGPDEGGPKWPQCIKYKIHAPLVKEFPNQKTTFASTVIGHTPTHTGTERINYEGDSVGSLLVRVMRQPNQRAELPPRLRYLIRACIKKVHIDGQPWKLVTEDPITTIWCQSFGIECISINQAELILYPGKKSSALPCVSTPREALEPVRKEKFGALSYASRGSGKLWKP